MYLQFQWVLVNLIDKIFRRARHVVFKPQLYKKPICVNRHEGDALGWKFYCICMNGIYEKKKEKAFVVPSTMDDFAPNVWVAYVKLIDERKGIFILWSLPLEIEVALDNPMPAGC